MTNNMRILKLLFLLTFLSVFSNVALAEEKLAKDENKGFARSCFETVVNDAFGDDAFSSESFYTKDGYSYWNSNIENIHNSGADISTVIRLVKIEKSGGNNGWGTETSKVTYQYFECVFRGVAKGDYPEPDFFLRYPSKGKFETWAKRIEYDNTLWARLEKIDGWSENWAKIYDIPDDNRLDYDLWFRHYDVAKARKPKSHIWGLAFEE
jgi:hypothetical protein